VGIGVKEEAIAVSGKYDDVPKDGSMCRGDAGLALCHFGAGTLLGLSLSYDIIVKQHAGSIEVDTQPGEFTEFKVILPRAAAASKTGAKR
jgi:signal transduction histidine kinase